MQLAGIVTNFVSLIKRAVYEYERARFVSLSLLSLPLSQRAQYIVHHILTALANSYSTVRLQPIPDPLSYQAKRDKVVLPRVQDSFMSGVVVDVHLCPKSSRTERSEL